LSSGGLRLIAPPLPRPRPLNLAMGSLSGMYFEWPVEIFQAICSIRRIECFPHSLNLLLLLLLCFDDFLLLFIHAQNAVENDYYD